MSNKHLNPCVRFGHFLLEKRKKAGKTARIVAGEAELLPSNYSKIETGTVRPPQDPKKLKLLGKAIGLQHEDDWSQYHDLAAKANETVPLDLVSIIGERELVPVFLRTVRNKQVSDAILKEIIHKLQD